ncbi:MAG: CDP-diacylglycerol--glycerol-3-phosphate 3-phosphatidyltransferase [Thermosulfidibacteraceae bacterium]|jgi:CDP-diacylglycerol--glycerol-3-phosphate 3-phosphatidyltransferase
MKAYFSKKYLPNMLTISRIVLSPIIYLLFSMGKDSVDKIAAIIFILASVTDILDGMIARRMDLASNFGKVVDPIADKLLMFSVLLPFVERGIITSFVLYVIFFRDMVVMALRNLAASKGTTLGSDMSGKVKTFVLFMSVCIYPFGYVKFALYGFYLGALISVFSGVDYLIKYSKFLSGGGNVQ